MSQWVQEPMFREDARLFYGVAWFNGRRHILTADRIRGPWFVGDRPVAWNKRRHWHYVDVKLDINELWSTAGCGDDVRC